MTLLYCIEGWDSLLNLEVLELFNNQLTEEPELSYLPKLNQLNMNDNPFSKKKLILSWINKKKNN